MWCPNAACCTGGGGSRLKAPCWCVQVVEHVDDGYAISGAASRIAQAPQELRAAFNYGRANRDLQVCV
jgi:hypothetical protein